MFLNGRYWSGLRALGSVSKILPTKPTATDNLEGWGGLSGSNSMGVKTIVFSVVLVVA